MPIIDIKDLPDFKTVNLVDLTEDSINKIAEAVVSKLNYSVRHGHWIERTKVYPALFTDSTYIYECSNCGYMDTHGANVEVPYCWHCGARMDAPTQKSVGNALEALEKGEENDNCKGGCV